MRYELPGGEVIDTAVDLTFEQRNFLQRMMIFSHLKLPLAQFQARWRAAGNPVWQGAKTLQNPSAAARILLDLERKLAGG